MTREQLAHAMGAEPTDREYVGTLLALHAAHSTTNNGVTTAQFFMRGDRLECVIATPQKAFR